MEEREQIFTRLHAQHPPQFTEQKHFYCMPCVPCLGFGIDCGPCCFQLSKGLKDVHWHCPNCRKRKTRRKELNSFHLLSRSTSYCVTHKHSSSFLMLQMCRCTRCSKELKYFSANTKLLHFTLSLSAKEVSCSCAPIAYFMLAARRSWM